MNLIQILKNEFNSNENDLIPKNSMKSSALFLKGRHQNT